MRVSAEPFGRFPCQANAAARLASTAATEAFVLSDEDCRFRTRPEERRLNGIGFFSFFPGDGVLEGLGRSDLSRKAHRDLSGVPTSFLGGTLPDLVNPILDIEFNDSADFRLISRCRGTCKGNSPSNLAI